MHAERRQRIRNTAYEDIMSKRFQSIIKSTYEKCLGLVFLMLKRIEFGFFIVMECRIKLS